ncbi:MAG TPA: hypothetical protein VME17_04060 [Bryobacteraceae bacterium]|nr:hypothetical protein [Bryobacteraceae bacterium]
MLKWIALALFCASLHAQRLKPVIDNEHVTVWDVTWTKGQTSPAPRDRDAVVMRLTGPHAGTASFIAKGRERTELGHTGARWLVIELKDYPAQHYPNTSGYPPAFPRPHVKKLLENDRVVVWSYRWNAGEPTPMHFHDKDVVVVYLEDTALTSTTPNGTKKLNEYKAFDIRFNQGNRTHYELLAHGAGSAMMMELK